MHEITILPRVLRPKFVSHSNFIVKPEGIEVRSNLYGVFRKSELTIALKTVSQEVKRSVNTEKRCHDHKCPRPSAKHNKVNC